jgi:hypothetical protein
MAAKRIREEENTGLPMTTCQLSEKLSVDVCKSFYPLSPSHAAFTRTTRSGYQITTLFCYNVMEKLGSMLTELEQEMKQDLSAKQLGRVIQLTDMSSVQAQYFAPTKSNYLCYIRHLEVSF